MARRLTSAWVVLCGAMLAASCRSVNQEMRLERVLREKPCNSPPVGLGRTELVRAATPETQLIERNEGALVIRTTITFAGKTWLLPRTHVRLTRATQDHAWSGMTDAGGWVRADSLRVGEVSLLALRIGFSPQRDPATVRAGFADTLQVLMRKTFLCLTPVTTGALPN